MRKAKGTTERELNRRRSKALAGMLKEHTAPMNYSDHTRHVRLQVEAELAEAKNRAEFDANLERLRKQSAGEAMTRTMAEAAFGPIPEGIEPPKPIPTILSCLDDLAALLTKTIAELRKLRDRI